MVSSGAQRATQTLACFLAAIGQRVPGGVVVERGLRSEIEERWRAAYKEAGSGELQALRSADPELVEQESAKLGSALRTVLDRVSDGARVLVVGHSPTNEAAVLGLSERQGVEADCCPRRRGVWLDRGELEQDHRASLD